MHDMALLCRTALHDDDTPMAAGGKIARRIVKAAAPTADHSLDLPVLCGTSSSAATLKQPAAVTKLKPLGGGVQPDHLCVLYLGT